MSDGLNLCPFCHRDTWHIGDDGAGWCDTCGAEINRDAASLITDMSTKRTCHNDIIGGSFVCSECGALVKNTYVGRSYVDELGKRWYATSNGQGFNFCPNCGCKVVGE